MSGKNKRLNIGLFINQLDFEYFQEVWPPINNYCENNDLNLFIFSGKSLDSPIKYNKEQNIIYQLANQHYYARRTL